jgi:hypothetical protein
MIDAANLESTIEMAVAVLQFCALSPTFLLSDMDSALYPSHFGIPNNG